METFQGNNNKLIFKFPNKEINCLDTTDVQIHEILQRADISIIGNNNSVVLNFDSESNAKDLLIGEGFLLIVKGDNNRLNIGSVIVRSSSILGMTGLKLIVGQLPGLGAGVSRTANNCSIVIGNRVVVNGATIYLQEDNSHVCIGDDSQISWGVDIWCTDAHTITNLEGIPINYATSIDIGRHVWIGKDVKIGKNVRIPDNSIVGWGSIVTKQFNEANIIIAGIPAKVVKKGINWDRKSINKYLKERNI